MKPLGNLNLLFLFFSLAKPAKWDLLGLFWVCWRIIFPCAAVGNETAQKSPAKLTWAEPNWRDSSLLQCSVIPDDMMVCLFLCVCLPHSLGVIFLFWTSESRLSYSCVWVFCLCVFFPVCLIFKSSLTPRSLVFFFVSFSFYADMKMNLSKTFLLLWLVAAFFSWSLFIVSFISYRFIWPLWSALEWFGERLLTHKEDRVKKLWSNLQVYFSYILDSC